MQVGDDFAHGRRCRTDIQVGGNFATRKKIYIDKQKDTKKDMNKDIKGDLGYLLGRYL